MKRAALQIKKNREIPILKGHPWVYREAVKEIPDSLNTGDMVDLFSHKNQWLATGYVDTESKILIRLLPIGQGEAVSLGIRRLVKSAIELRRAIFKGKETDSCRLINGEGDFLPGLIVDKYAEALSMQIYSLGLEPFIKDICATLTSEMPEIRWIWRRNQIRLARQDASKLIFGKNLPEKIIFKENGMKFSTDLVNGQKTGFFLDQRNNRQMIRELAAGSSFLNICGYTGAFTVAAAAGGARTSVTVDIARPALAEAEANLRLNGCKNDHHQLVCADMYEFLQNQKQRFDLVVLDPPSMAKSRNDTEKALRAYQKLNLLGMKTVAAGGLLFTASCSSQVSREQFFDSVRDAAGKARRCARIISESFHAPDHPYSLAHPEGRYLKGLLLRLE